MPHFVDSTRIWTASPANPGAMITSRNLSGTAISRASSGDDRAVEREDAAEGRDRVARVRAAERLDEVGRWTAAPHGFLCLMTTAHGYIRNRASSSAADASRMLLYESSLPESCRAWATVASPGSSVR